MVDEPENVVLMAAGSAGLSLRQLAIEVGVSAPAVNRWRRENRIPLDRVPDVERVTGVPREKLSPEYYGAPRSRPTSGDDLAA